MNRHIKGKKNSKGFYIALGICLVAVGVAAWTTYDSVVNYAVPGKNENQSQTAPANNTVSGIYADGSSPSSKNSSSRAAVSSKAKAYSRGTYSKAPKKQVSKVPAKQITAKAEVYSYPAGKVILQKFSEDPVYCKTTQDWRAHTGIDLKADAGSAVKAIADGKVEKIYDDGRYGRTVEIKHGNLTAMYCGLDKTGVKTGDSVKSGQEIGTVGTVPIEKYEDSHLHFVIIKDGKYIDPLKVLKN